MSKMQVEIKQCSKGHFYESRFSSCPFCANNDEMPFEENKIDSYTATEPAEAAYQPTRSFSDSVKQFEIEDYDQTMPTPLDGEDTQYDPVVGWLVCTSGPNRGNSYRLHNGTNFIGRSENMDVCIRNDNMISHEKAASLSYDDRTKVFFLERGDGRNNIYKNGDVVRRDVDLVRMDKITIGASDFIFIPFCGESFSWNNI